MAAVELGSTLSLGTDPNLQGYWKLENVNDSSTNAYTLTNNGVTTFVAGKFNNGANFVSASSQYLSRTAATNLGITGTQTWSCWFKPASPGGTQYMMSVSTGNIGFYISSGLNVTFVMIGLTTPGAQAITAAATANNNAWNYVAGRFTSGSMLEIYLNGTWTSASSTGSPTVANTNFAIGGKDSGTNFMDGMVDDAAFFNRALTNTEVTDLYQGVSVATTGASFLLNFA